MSTATGRPTRLAPAPDHQREDHAQLHSSERRITRWWTGRPHTHTDRRRITSCRRRLVAPPDQRPHPTTNEKTTHSSERRITRWWTGRPHTHRSATDYIMSTATGCTTRPAPTPDHQPPDHAQLRATDYPSVDLHKHSTTNQRTTHTVRRRTT